SERSTPPRGRGGCPPPPREDAWERQSWLPLALHGDGRQAVERTTRLLNAYDTDVGIAAGGADGAMAQEILDQHQIGAGIAQVGSKTVRKAVRAVTIGQAGLGAGTVEDAPCRIERDRTGGVGAGKQPAVGLGQTPVGTQYFEQARRQHGQASLAALAGA